MPSGFNDMAATSRASSASPDSRGLDSSPSHSPHDSETSWSDGPPDLDRKHSQSSRRQNIQSLLPELFEENILAKCFRVGTNGLNTVQYSDYVAREPRGFPETVPQVGPKVGQYDLREAEFWTCGFFPGTLYALLERVIKYPQTLRCGEDRFAASIRPQLRSLCEAWSNPLHPMSNRTDTHDIGFIVMPALQRDWELFGNQRSLDSIINAARSLATRYIPSTGAIRSWDLLLKKEITVTDMNDNNLVIIDSLCNLDLLYYASAQSGEQSLADIATSHAKTLLDTHLRPESPTSFPNQRYRGQLYSTCHVANISPKTGSMKWRWTAQGYSNESTWSRGQAWAVLGYAQTYTWTKDTTFLDVACGVAEYFLYRLETSPSYVEMPVEGSESKRTKGRYVPLWDWDAPVNHENPLRDSSAGVIAANGMLVLSQALRGVGQHSLSRHFLDVALKIVEDTVDLSLAPESARFSKSTAGLSVEDTTSGQSFDGLLKNGTANNNENARRRYANHGLVYADYYLVEFGNRLLNMGLA